MHKVEDLYYSVFMLTDVVAKACGYSLTNMHVRKSQAIFLTRFVPFSDIAKQLGSQMPYTYQNICS